MSTFEHPLHFFVFEMKGGKHKLAYGTSPEDALAVLRMRLDAQEMAQILVDKYVKVSQRKVREHIHDLG